MNLGETIYRLRTEKGMSQEDLADAMAVSRQSISKWENNNATPELDKLLKLSEIFEISLDDLVGKEPPKSKPVQPVSLSQIPTRKIVGTVLLACAFIVFCISLTVGSISLFFVPFALCGVACFVFQRHTGVWCAWALYLPLSIVPLREYIRSDFAFYITLFVQLPILIYTVMDFRNEPLILKKPGYLLLGLGYLLWAVYFFDRVASFFRPYALQYDWPAYLMEFLSFPLLNALITVTLRLLRTSRATKN